MDRRAGMSGVFVLLFSLCASGQQTGDGNPVDRPLAIAANTVDATVVQRSVSGLPSKQEVERGIALLEDAVRDGESKHASDYDLAKWYMQIGLWYEDLAVWGRAEVDLEHAVLLFRRASSSNGELAVAISNLASLHVAKGKLRDAEEGFMEALKLRLATNDALQVARSESDLAALYLAQHKFEKAKDSAERSLHEVITNEGADNLDRVFARYVYSLALCATNECPRAIPVLKDAVEDAKATMQPRDFPIGYGEFFLGYAYWKSGDSAGAAQYMGQGVSLMKEQLGWGHPTYLSALDRYEKFLRENRRGEEAKVVRSEIRKAEAVVDVRSLQASAFGFGGLR